MTATLAEARRIIEGAIAKVRELKAEISVTVCDANGLLVALNRMDAARAETNHYSIGKAVVAAASERGSRDFDRFLSSDWYGGRGTDADHPRGRS